ncbi:MAG TPA: PilZ domain-containing protein [Geminicoccaceae bacterium]|nr:PilZ domain-containing protein [Geminicoccaceae bacterium]
MSGDISSHQAEANPLPPEDRRYRRYPAPLEAQLLVDGSYWRCWIRDISVAGAGLDPAIPAALGRRAELHSPHFDFAIPLPGRVINVAPERTCLEFDLDEATARKLTVFLASTVDGK